MRLSILPLIFVCLLVISCQKELNEFIPEVQASCRITTGYYYGGSGGLNDSTIFTYDGNKVVRADAYDSYVLYSYSGDNISTRKFYYTPGDELFQIDSIQYGANNKISRIVTWAYDDMIAFDTSQTILNFHYTGIRLDRITEIYNLFTPFGMETETYENIFTTNAAGNIEKIVFADALMDPYDSIAYTYNVDPNYFNVAHPHFFLFDPYFQLHAGLIPHLPYFYSTNNVRQFIIYDGWEYEITYGLDSVNKVTGINMDGDEYVKYKYKCE